MHLPKVPLLPHDFGSFRQSRLLGEPEFELSHNSLAIGLNRLLKKGHSNDEVFVEETRLNPMRGFRRVIIIPVVSCHRYRQQN